MTATISTCAISRTPGTDRREMARRDHEVFGDMCLEHNADSWDQVMDIPMWMGDNDVPYPEHLSGSLSRIGYGHADLISNMLAARRDGLFDAIDLGGISWNISLSFRDADVLMAYRLRYGA